MAVLVEMTVPGLVPPAPKSIADTGLNPDVILQIVTKMLHVTGELTGSELAARLGVFFPIIEPSLTFLRQQAHCEVAGGSPIGSSGYRYRLTDSGRGFAAMLLQQNQYVGRLPVPVHQYTRYMADFARRIKGAVTRRAVARAFDHLVLSDHVLDQLGPALAARHSLFIYGPPGNGKTVIAQAIRNLLNGEIAIPHALAVDGHVVVLFDPVTHDEIPPPPERGDSLVRDHAVDDRWVLCRRPLVTAGGELMLEDLDLGYSESAGFYRAPLQTLANGGVLVIDDFGRQHVSPRDLLNRWIVPLESRVDHMTLRTGQKFQLPFDALVVFATNLDPADLVDEAFLRRIQYKVYAESPTRDEFSRIFERCCEERDVPFDAGLVEALLRNELKPRGVALRGCQPRDLIDQALAIAGYQGLPRTLTPDLLAAACDSYFVGGTAQVA